SGYGSGDIAVTCQHDDLGVIPALTDRLYHVEAVTIPKSQVDYRIFRRRGFGLGDAFGNRRGNIYREAPRFHGAGESAQKRSVIVDDQEAGIGSNDVIHGLADGR